MKKSKKPITMGHKTFDALQASIDKWKNNATPGAKISLGPDGCALCLLHNDWFSESNGVTAEASCLGCPIFKATGGRYCERTNYGEIEWWHQERNYKEFRKSSKKMLELLEDINLRARVVL